MIVVGLIAMVHVLVTLGPTALLELSMVGGQLKKFLPFVGESQELKRTGHLLQFHLTGHLSSLVIWILVIWILLSFVLALATLKAASPGWWSQWTEHYPEWNHVETLLIG